MDKNFVIRLLDKNGNPSRMKKKSILTEDDWGFLKSIHPIDNAALYCILYDINPPKCYCGNFAYFRNFKVGFGNTCSQACSAKIGAESMRRLWEEGDKEKHDSIHAKRRVTMTEKYGYDHPLKAPEIVASLKRNRKQKDYVASKATMGEYFPGDIESHDYWKHLCASHTSVRKLADAHGVFFAYVYRWWEKIGFESPFPRCSSGGEREVSDFLKCVGVDHVTNDRSILGGKEMDIYIPSKGIAIEFDGLYWHKNCSSREKQKLAALHNISLLCVFEDEWEHKREIVKSMILDRVGLTPTKIHARKTVVGVVDKPAAEQFLNDNHIAGFAVAKEHIGLYFRGELVCVASIGKSRFGDDSLELIRMCTKKYINVVGGVSKLLNGRKLVSYADRRYSPMSSAYGMFGDCVGETQNGYFWVYKNRRLSRFQTQKHKLEKLLKVYDPSKTEKENMEANGAYKIYDCGHWKYNLDFSVKPSVQIKKQA